MSKRYYIIPIFVPMEGCPHKCVFCNQDRITGEKEKVTALKVRKTIEEYLETINSDATIEVSFFGGTFTGVRESLQRELLAIAKEYKDKNKINYIRLSTRPDYINNYILGYLKDYGVDVIELGVQSLDEEVLHAAGRGHSKESVYTASKLIKEYGFILGHQLMPGLPKATAESDIRSAKESLNIGPDIVRIYPSLVIKDTPMEEMYLRGDYKPYSLNKAVEVSREIYKLFKEKNINVIRIGLQPTEAINEGGDVVAGPFHPSIRELVEGSYFANEIRNKLTYVKKGEVIINPKDISKLYAGGKRYFNELIEEGYNVSITLDEDICRGDILVR